MWPSSLTDEGLKGILFANSPYGMPNFYGLEFSTMKVLRAVFLANVPMESFIFIHVGLKGCVLTNIPQESFIFYGLQLSPTKVLKAICFAKVLMDFLTFMALSSRQ